MNDANAGELVRRAELAERTGRFDEAKQCWDALIASSPTHPRALYIQGRQRLERGDAAGALALLCESERLDPAFADAPLYAALAHRMDNNLPAALAALDRALAIDPYFFTALLSKGAIQEHMGKPRLAARSFANAIKIAPAPERLPPAQRAALDHARELVADNSRALAEYLRSRTSAARSQFKGERLDRFDESLDILAGVKRRHVHEPILLYYPRLPATPFYDRELFPWLGELEAATDAIRGELGVVLREDWGEFAPYIQLPPEAPVNQWAELNHSSLWTTYFLWRDGVREEANCERCPQTSALLDRLPLARQPSFAPTAVFSVLQPHTRIPPHTGSTNARLLTHLPLILPPGCGFRVGNDTREWRMGEAWVFDDSIDHEAWNESGEVRVIMIFDVWNPLLTEAERTLVSEMMSALNEYNRGA
jgi:aspartyl/asparaginyl beta-hydroxylase (cupin superfamily)